MHPINAIVPEEIKTLLQKAKTEPDNVHQTERYALVKKPQSTDEYYIVEKIPEHYLAGKVQGITSLSGINYPIKEELFLKLVIQHDENESTLLESATSNKYLGNTFQFQTSLKTASINATVLVTPYLGSQNLRQYLENSNSLSDEERLDLVIALLKQYVELEALDIRHGDIKPENIIIHDSPMVSAFPKSEVQDIEKPSQPSQNYGKNLVLNFSDFGNSNTATSGSVGYNIPALENQPANLCADRFALVCTIADILNIQNFNEKSDKNENVNFHNSNLLISKIKEKFPPDASSSITLGNPVEIFTTQIQTILNHPYKTENVKSSPTELPSIDNMLKQCENIKRFQYEAKTVNTKNISDIARTLSKMIYFIEELKKPKKLNNQSATLKKIYKKYHHETRLTGFIERLKWLREKAMLCKEESEAKLIIKHGWWASPNLGKGRTFNCLFQQVNFTEDMDFFQHLQMIFHKNQTQSNNNNENSNSKIMSEEEISRHRESKTYKEKMLRQCIQENIKTPNTQEFERIYQIYKKFSNTDNASKLKAFNMNYINDLKAILKDFTPQSVQHQILNQEILRIGQKQNPLSFNFQTTQKKSEKKFSSLFGRFSRSTHNQLLSNTEASPTTANKK